MRAFDVDECRAYIEASSKATDVIIGADSERHKVRGAWHYTVTTAVIVHIDGNRGCRVFGDAYTARDYDPRKDRPAMRLMAEVEAASAMYLLLEEAIGDHPVAIHLDISPDLKNGSSCVIHEAIGYIRGTCGITPKVKPDAFGASHTADRLQEVIGG